MAKPRKGQEAVDFINRLTHTGDYSGTDFKLRPWQEKHVREIFGSKRADGLRKYRKVFFALPRKQGKTELCAGIALYLMLGTGKTGQHIYSASGDHNQAALIFRAAASMVRNDPELAAVCIVYDGYKRIECKPLGSFYQALSSEASLKHGLSPSAVLFDELHVLPNRELFNVLTTGFGARREPLTIMITTAGWDRNSLCWEQWDYARKVRDKVIADDGFLPILYEAKDTDDWSDEKLWHKVMPALGDFCELDFLRDEFKKAKNLPRFENTFKQLYLNMWTQQSTRWLPMDRWNECGEPIDESSLAGLPCFGGLDLSQTRDLTSFALAFPTNNGISALSYNWAPMDGLWRQEAANRDLYELWADQGFLTLTPGEVVDYQYVEDQIAGLAAIHDIRKIFADRAMAMQLCLRLRDVHGIDVEFLPQTPMVLNGPTRELERIVTSRLLSHGGNPILTWAAANAAIRENATGLIQLHKSKSTGRIDPLAALINAIAAQASTTGQGEPSVYDEAGVVFI